VGDEGAQPDEQRVPRGLVPEPRLALCAQRGDLVGVDGDDQLATVWEVPVHCGVADPGPAGHLVQGRAGSPLTEDLSGGSQQQVVVALRVGPAGTPRPALP